MWRYRLNPERSPRNNHEVLLIGRYPPGEYQEIRECSGHRRPTIIHKKFPDQLFSIKQMETGGHVVEVKRKRGGQPGNQNAIGNHGGAPIGNKNAVGHGAPFGNKNALKHGLYSRFLLPTPVNRQIVHAMELAGMEPSVTLFWELKTELLEKYRPDLLPFIEVI